MTYTSAIHDRLEENTMKAYKIELYLFDINEYGYGIDEYKRQIEKCTECLAHFGDIKEKELPERDDDCVFNQEETPIEEYRSLFKNIQPNV